jgi:hypothetical protein
MPVSGVKLLDKSALLLDSDDVKVGELTELTGSKNKILCAECLPSICHHATYASFPDHPPTENFVDPIIYISSVNIK